MKREQLAECFVYCSDRDKMMSSDAEEEDRLVRRVGRLRDSDMP